MQGHIHKRVHRCRDGRETVRWYVVVDVPRHPDGRRRQRWHGGFRTRREAEVVRAKIVNELHDGRYVIPARVTLTEWIRDGWLPVIATQVKPTTARSYRQLMESHVLPVLGSRRVGDITPRDLVVVYSNLIAADRPGRPLSRSTVRNIHLAIHKAFADASDAGLLAANPASRAKPPRPIRGRGRPISVWRASELAQFLEFVESDRLGAVWRLTAMTGMRRGEVLALRWEDIDLAGGRLVVSRALIELDCCVLESTPKGNAARAIDLDPATVAALARHRELQRRERAEWGEAYRDDDFLVALEDGSPVRPSAFSGMFGTLVRRSGLRPIRLHDLRHVHATLALQAGVPLTVVAERLGHHSPSFTLAQYAHAIPGMQAAAAARIADMISPESR
jgi:integrase